jgi:hypothetical protein
VSAVVSVWRAVVVAAVALRDAIVGGARRVRAAVLAAVVAVVSAVVSAQRAAVGAVVAVRDAVVAAFRSVVAWFVAVRIAVASAVVLAWRAVVGAVVALRDAVVAAVHAALRAVVGSAVALRDAIVGGARRVGATIVAAWSALRAAGIAIGRSVASGAVAMRRAVVGTVIRSWDAVVRTLAAAEHAVMRARVATANGALRAVTVTRRFVLHAAAATGAAIAGAVRVAWDAVRTASDRIVGVVVEGAVAVGDGTRAAVRVVVGIVVRAVAMAVGAVRAVDRALAAGASTLASAAGAVLEGLARIGPPVVRATALAAGATALVATFAAGSLSTPPPIGGDVVSVGIATPGLVLLDAPAPIRREGAVADAATQSVPAPLAAAHFDRVRPPLPVAVAVAAHGIAAPLVPVGIEANGEMEIPGRVAEVGWFEPADGIGVVPGERGTAVLAGHVDSRTQGPGAFHRLGLVAVGDRVEVTHDDGSFTKWRVVAVQRYPKPDVPIAELFTWDGPPGLVLVTCGGEFDRTTRSYAENYIVLAEPMARVSAAP